MYDIIFVRSHNFLLSNFHTLCPYVNELLLIFGLCLKQSANILNKTKIRFNSCTIILFHDDRTTVLALFALQT